MENIVCPACKKENKEQLETCNNCNFPFNGTEQEKGVHIGRFINKKSVITDSEGAIKKSQFILYAIAAYNAIFLIIGLFGSQLNVFDLLLNFVVVGIFVLCAFFIQKKPLLLTLIPLILILGINMLNYFIEPSSVFRGIVFKLIIIGSLIYSIYLIKGAADFKKEFDMK
tara:strand:+ start:68 stop:574 length:507 start_codon:yes stop_codon:yes gene_type:complete